MLDTPPTATTTLPVVAAAGTTATIDVALQLVIEVAVVPLKATVFVPCVDPKLLPVIVTEVPTAPEVGDRLVIDGGGVTVNGEPLLDTPPTATTTLPVVAAAGTTATIDVALQLVTDVAVVPLKVTVLVPCVAPKLVPVMVTEAPTGPDVGDKLVIAGGGVTVNATALLEMPFEVTTTFPVVAPVGTTATIEVALQLVIDVAVVPLKVTVLVPCVEPKLVPEMVTELPTGPEVGERLLIAGEELLRPVKLMSLRAGVWPAAVVASVA